MSARRAYIVAAATVGVVGFAYAGSLEGNENIESQKNFSTVSLREGEMLTQARTRVMKSGWKPVQMHQHDNYEYSGAEGLLKRHGFVEVDSCSTDAGVRCIFYYEKSEQCLRIDTVGEHIVDMTVTRWALECPGR